MLAKLAILLHGKVALAVIGGLLVVGTGATAAAAATGHLPITIPGITHSEATHTPDADGNNDNHAHTVAVEGTLKAYDATAHTITVTGQKADADSNDTGNTDNTGNTGDDTTPTPSATHSSDDGSDQNKGVTQGTFTIAVNGDTRVNGKHASTLADLTKAIGSKVQVQANDDGKGNLTAWKVTITGDDNNGSGGNGDQGHAFVGTVGSVNTGASSFTLAAARGDSANNGTSPTTLTVDVSSQTKFAGTVHSLSDLHSGMRVAVLGTTQSSGSVAASEVASLDGGSGDNHQTIIAGTVSSVNAPGMSFVTHTVDNHDVAVHVSAQTVFDGDAHSFAGLSTSMEVAALGTTQSDGSLNATRVETRAHGGN
jgi:hypothetical protein